VVEGGYGATVGETGPEKPDVLIVPAARIYDLVPVRELPYGPAAPSLHQRPDRWQHPTTCQPSSKNRLHLAGRPQMSTRWVRKTQANAPKTLAEQGVDKHQP
jgi:hypothetical protein